MKEIFHPVCVLTWFALYGAGCNSNSGEPRADGGSSSDGSLVCRAEGVEISGEIAEDQQWSCPLYVLRGIVFVVNDSTLTIEAGTEVIGETGFPEVAALIVTRGSQLVANGTADDPVVFTSANLPGARLTGDWAGLALLGSATTNDGECREGSADDCAGGFLQDRLEGINAADPRSFFGGRQDGSSCGSLRYVRIEFAGRELSPENELNGLTLGACGSGTTLSHVQVHRGKDDGVEFFGGTASMDHVVISGASDDSLDFDEGWRGNGQFVVIHQFPGIGDRGIEADNLGSNEAATPVTQPYLWNVTMVGTDDNKVALFREGMTGIFGNFLVAGYGKPLDIIANTVDPGMNWPTDFVVEGSLFYENGDIPAEADSLATAWTMADVIAGGALDDGAPGTVREFLGAVDDAERDGTITEEQADEISDYLTANLDDDFSFDESAELMDAARSNTFGTDPMIGNASPTAPDYVPGATLPAGRTPRFSASAPAGYGDAAATYPGAFDPDAAVPWTDGWTAFPEN